MMRRSSIDGGCRTVLRRSAVPVVAVLGVSVGLAGCYRPTGEDRSRWLVSIDAEGGGRADLVPAAVGAQEADLRAVGDRAAPLLFPVASSRRVEVVRPPGASSYVRVRAWGVYRPGRSATWALDLRPAVSDLVEFAAGCGVSFGHLRVSVALPPVPASVRWSLEPARGEQGYWEWDEVSAGPAGTVTMAPRPWRSGACAVLAVASLALVIGSVLVGRRRRRAVEAGLSLAGVVAAAGALIFSSGSWSSELGVAGLLSGWPLTLVGVMVPVLAGVAAVAGLIVLVRLAAAARRRSDRSSE